MPFPVFDRSQLKLLPLADRDHDINLSELLPLDAVPHFEDANLDQVADRVLQARRSGRPVVLMMGAHVIKRGLSRFVVDLMERGILTHIGLNGAGVIHDFELALVGATSESVARYIKEGQFGLWQETGRINDAIIQGSADHLGLGEAVA